MAEFQSGLEAYYAACRFEHGFASRCRMTLPDQEVFAGKTVLDVGCRRGKGAYKLGSLVGADGLVIGLDWNADYLAEARAGVPRALRKSGLARSNMEFRAAYPENLEAAGIESAAVDVVYVNSVANLFFDQERALREFGRALKPGGLLVLETVVADRARGDEELRAARQMGNSVQSARTMGEVAAWLVAAGFDAPVVADESTVAAGEGSAAGVAAPVAEAMAEAADVQYRAILLLARKRGATASDG